MAKINKLKNLMDLFQEEEPTKKVKNILDKKSTNNIKTVKFDKYTINFGESYYFLDCVPIIPNEYNVIGKWSNYLPIWVNWNKESTIEYKSLDGTITQCHPVLKKQYGFCATLETKEIDKLTKRKKQVYCSMIFNNANTCNKHLEWFNSCFPVETKEQPEKITFNKTKKKSKK